MRPLSFATSFDNFKNNFRTNKVVPKFGWYDCRFVVGMQKFGWQDCWWLQELRNLVAEIGFHQRNDNDNAKTLKIY